MVAQSGNISEVIRSISFTSHDHPVILIDTRAIRGGTHVILGYSSKNMNRQKALTLKLHSEILKINSQLCNEMPVLPRSVGGGGANHGRSVEYIPGYSQPWLRILATADPELGWIYLHIPSLASPRLPVAHTRGRDHRAC